MISVVLGGNVLIIYTGGYDNYPTALIGYNTIIGYVGTCDIRIAASRDPDPQ